MLYSELNRIFAVANLGKMSKTNQYRLGKMSKM